MRPHTFREEEEEESWEDDLIEVSPLVAIQERARRRQGRILATPVPTPLPKEDANPALESVHSEEVSSMAGSTSEDHKATLIATDIVTSLESMRKTHSPSSHVIIIITGGNCHLHFAAKDPDIKTA